MPFFSSSADLFHDFDSSCGFVRSISMIRSLMHVACETPKLL